MIKIINIPLEKLIVTDSLGKLYKKIEEITNGYNLKLTEYEDIANTLKNIKPEDRKNYDFKKEEDIKKASDAFSLDFERLEKYLDLGYGKVDAIKRGIDYEKLKEEGKELLQKSGVLDVNLQNITEPKPYIIFYTSESCFPCSIMKPTFAQLAQFFDRVKIFHSTDLTSIAEKDCLVPQLIGYFDKGYVHYMITWPSTRKLWLAMNQLITEGSKFEGTGVLVYEGSNYHVEKRELHNGILNFGPREYESDQNNQK